MNYRKILPLLLLVSCAEAAAQPEMEDILKMNESIVQVSVDLDNGSTGTGSGVVVSDHYVATNCHVIVNAHGANVAKYGDGYQPVALKADWKHDLCLLKFDSLPFKPAPMRDSASLKYEEEIFGLSFPNDAQVPQASYGSVKALYPYDGSVIVRTSAAFALGSSGGAMFDQQFNLIGISTFKSPGRRPGYFYSLPVEWIRKLMAAPELLSLKSDELPFWALPEDQRPYFMQVVIPYQQEKWQELKQVADRWIAAEPDNADAWYYQGVAEYGLQQKDEAARDLSKAVTLNERHLDSRLKLAMLAIDAGNKVEAEKIRDAVRALDSDEADNLEKRIAAMP